MYPKLVADPVYPHIFSVFWEDELVFCFSTKIFPKSLFMRTFSGKQEIEDQLSLEEFPKARFFLIKKLAKRALTTHQAKNFLSLEKVRQDTINKVVEELSCHGYLDDQEIARAYIRGCISKNKGEEALKKKLYDKKFPKHLIEFAIQEYQEQAPVAEQIKDLIEKKFLKDLRDGAKGRQRLIRKLLNRGFTYSQIQEVIDR